MDTFTKQDLEFLEELAKKCPRCGKASASSSNPSGRCRACLNKLKQAKKTPGHYLRAHMKADDALRRQKGKNGTAHKKSSGLGSRKTIVKQVKSAEKKIGQKLSPDRKQNAKGYAPSNTRMVPEKLNRGRHTVDPKKLTAWKKRLKKHNLDLEKFRTLLMAKATLSNNEELAKSILYTDFDIFSELFDETAAPNIEQATDEQQAQEMKLHKNMQELLERLQKAKQTTIKILLIQGGARSKNSCPGEDSKGQLVVKELKKSAPAGVEIDILDLSVDDTDRVIRSCKNCIGTASGYHCHWQCSCYGPGSAAEKLSDVMHDEHVYDRLKKADGFIVMSPTNWGTVTTNLKAMFDRLVCANLTLTKEQATEILDGDIKNPKKTQPLHRKGTYDHLLKNHLEGKVAGFYMWGVGGGDDYVNKTLPASMDGLEHTWNIPNTRPDNIIDQCRYSGIHVPEQLIKVLVRNTKEDYSTIDENFREDPYFLAAAKTLLSDMVKFIKTLKHN